MPSETKNPNYRRIEKNIYKTGKSYRTRVGDRSTYSDTLKEARWYKKMFKQTAEPIF